MDSHQYDDSHGQYGHPEPTWAGVISLLVVSLIVMAVLVRLVW